MLGEMNLDLRYAEPHLENYPVTLTCLFSVAFRPADRNIKSDAPPLDVPLWFVKKREEVMECATKSVSVQK